MSARRVLVGKVGSMSDDDDTRTVVSLLGPDPDRPPRAAPGITVPDTGARYASYTLVDGRLASIVTADTADDYGRRMTAHGRSHRRGILARIFRTGTEPERP